jgi:hypothetical protein
VASCASAMSREEQVRLRSYEGKIFEVIEIDRYGMIWFQPEEGNGNFSLKPGEVAVI